MGSMGLDIYRLVAIVVIVTAALLGTRAARHFAEEKGSSRRAANANAMAGGFLLGAGLFHFLPDAHRHFELLYPHHIFPYGSAIAAAGFTAVLSIERLLFDPTAHAMEHGAKGTAPVVAIVLSIHALVSGMAVGAERTSLTLISVALAWECTSSPPLSPWVPA